MNTKNKVTGLKAKTPRDAAKEFKKYLVELMSLNPEEKALYERKIVLRSPEESKLMEGSECWSLSWEEGPFEWAPNATGGISIFSGELGEYIKGRDYPEGLCNDYVFAEAHNSFTLCFYKN